MELSIEPTDVGEIVQVAADQLGEFARQKGLEWRVQIPAGLSPSLLDRHHFIQILTNLMGNAIKFTDVGGVETRLIAEGHRAVGVEVEDTGVGIPEEALPFIFEAYERMQAPHTRNVEGTGLGLAISKSLAELMGCSLEVESTVGEGSTFRLNLPL